MPSWDRRGPARRVGSRGGRASRGRQWPRWARTLAEAQLGRSWPPPSLQRALSPTISSPPPPQPDPLDNAGGAAAASFEIAALPPRPARPRQTNRLYHPATSGGCSRPSVPAPRRRLRLHDGCSAGHPLCRHRRSSARAVVGAPLLAAAINRTMPPRRACHSALPPAPYSSRRCGGHHLSQRGRCVSAGGRAGGDRATASGPGCSVLTEVAQTIVM